MLSSRSILAARSLPERDVDVTAWSLTRSMRSTTAALERAASATAASAAANAAAAAAAAASSLCLRAPEVAECEGGDDR